MKEGCEESRATLSDWASATAHTKLRAIEEACQSISHNALPCFPNDSYD